MSTITVEQLYEQIKPMSAVEQLRLVAMITQRLVRESVPTKTIKEPKHSIMELHGVAPQVEKPERSLLELEGLGAEIWQGIDAREYVDELRQEWDHRP